MLSGRLREYLPFLFCLIWFSLFLSQSLSIAHDSMGFLLRAVSGHLWHANHLFTLPLMAGFIEAGAIMKLPLTPMELATIPNILCGAMTIQLVFLFLRRRLELGYTDSLLGCFLPAASFGIWYYSVAIEAYAIPVFLMLLCVYLLADQNRTAKTFWIVAVIHSLAALFHQFAVLIGPLIVYALWAAPAIEGRKKIAVFASYVMITAVLVGGTYVAVAVLTQDVTSLEGFLAWLPGNAGAEGASQFVGGFEIKTIVLALVGFGRSLVGGHFVFAVPELSDLLSKVFGAQSLDDERFLVQDLSPLMARGLMAISVLWGLTLLTALFRSVSCRKDIRHTEPIVMILWVFVPLTVMFTFYFGQNLELWLVQSVCFWVFLAWTLAKLNARRMQLSLLVGLLLINIFGSMQFAGNANRDFNQWRLQPILESLAPGDLIVIGDWWPTADFVEYFAKTEPLVLSRRYQEKAEVVALTKDVMDRLANGGQVFIYDDVYHPDKSSVSFYGSGYIDFVDQFRQSIPQAPALSPAKGQQHRLLRPAMSAPTP